jgi:DNA-binding IclR family transcriptional regulator
VRSRPQDAGVDGAQAIRRAVDVVRVVAQIQRSRATLSRVTEGTGLSTSTAFRILRSLTEEGLLRFHEAERAYSVGPLAFELGLAATDDNDAAEHWRGAVDQVARQTRLTTYLMVRSGRDAACLVCVQASTAIRAIAMDVGQRLPLGIGAGSAAILATLEDWEIQQILAAHGPRLKLYPGGSQQVKQIWERVAQIRRHGFSMSSGTVAAGVSGVGVAIKPQDGLLQFAISVSAPKERFELTEGKAIAAIISSVIRKHGG